MIGEVMSVFSRSLKISKVRKKVRVRVWVVVKETPTHSCPLDNSTHSSVLGN